ncbi:MAG: hypothetical protein RLZZ387_5698 [Chloroflexota bacterium]|jgi:hypothetical protein
METTCTKLIAPGLIDSNLKLRVLLVFCRHPQLRAGVQGLGQRLPGNPWALEEALVALAEGGVLERAWAHGHWEYSLSLRGDVRLPLESLAACFDDPHRRDDIYALVRSAEQEQHYRSAGEKWRVVGSGDGYEPLVV